MYIVLPIQHWLFCVYMYSHVQLCVYYDSTVEPLSLSGHL